MKQHSPPRGFAIEGAVKATSPAVQSQEMRDWDAPAIASKARRGHFMDLPMEVRQMILEYIIPTHAVIENEYYHEPRAFDTESTYKYLAVHSNIDARMSNAVMRTNMQLYYDAQDIIAKGNQVVSCAIKLSPFADLTEIWGL